MRKSGRFPIQTPDGVFMPTGQDDDCEVLRPDDETDRIQPAGTVKIRLNYRALLVLMALIVLVPLLVIVAHEYQMRRMANSFLDRADRAEQDGDLDAASRNLESYLRFKPDDITARIRMTLNTVAAAEKPADKQRAFNQINDVLRDAPERDDLRRKRAELLLESGSPGRIRQAIEDLTLLINHLRSVAPHDADFAEAQKEMLELEVLRAAAHELVFNTDAAIAAYERAIRIDPQHARSRQRLADLYSRAGERDKAEAVLRKLVQDNPESFEPHVVRGYFYNETGNVDAAVQDAQIAYQKAPNNLRVLLLAATVISAEAKLRQEYRSFDLAEIRQKLENALPNVAKSVEDDPDFATASKSDIEQAIEERRQVVIDALANLDLVAHQPEAAIDRLQAAIDENPENVAYQWSLANILIGENQLDRAQELLDGIDDGDFPRAQKLYLQARIFAARGDWREAIEITKKISGDPTLSRMFPATVELLRAECEAQLGHTREKLYAYQRAVDANPNSGPARIGLAAAWAQVGRLDEALQTLSVMESSPQVPLLMADFEIARNLQRPPNDRDWTETQRLLDLAAARGEDLTTVLLKRADVQQYQKNWKAARAFLEEARRRQSDDLAPWLALARFEATHDSIEQGLKTLDEAQKRFGPNLAITQVRLSMLLRVDRAAVRQQLTELLAGLDGYPQPQRSEILQMAAFTYQQLGETADALDTWKRLTDLQPHNLQAFLRQLNLALIIRDFAQAHEIISQIAAVEGNDGSQVQLAQARLFIAQAEAGDRRRIDEAREILNSLQSKTANVPEVLIALGSLEELDGNQDAALEYYLEALFAGSAEPIVIREIVRRLNARGRHDEATRAIEQFRKNSRNPISPDLRQMAAQTLQSAGEYEQALAFALQDINADSPDFRDHLWVAKLYEAAERLDDAERSLKLALKIGGSHPQPWIDWLTFLKQSGREDEIAQELATAKKQLENAEDATALAQVYQAVGDFERAEKNYLAAVQAAPDDIPLRLAVAEFYNKAGQRRKSEPHLRQVLQPDSAATPAQRAFARRALAFDLGTFGNHRQRAEAIELLNENLAQDPRSLLDLRTKAIVLAENGSRNSVRQALQIYQQLDERKLLSLEDRLVMANLLTALNEWPRARTVFRELLDDPASPPAILANGIRAMLQNGESRGMEEWVNRLTAAEPNTLRTLAIRAQFLYANYKSQEADELLNTATQPVDDNPPLATKSQVAQILVGIGQFLERSGRPVEARNVMKRAEAMLTETLKDNPDNVFLLAGLLEMQQDYGGALEALNRGWGQVDTARLARTALSLVMQLPDPGPWTTELRKRLDQEIQTAPDATDLYPRAADLAHFQQDYDEAVRLLNKALEHASDNPAPVENELAVIYALRRQNLDVALNLIEDAIVRSGDAPQLLDTRAMVYIALGEEQQAIDDLTRALAAEESAMKYFHLAQAYEQQGNQPLAKAAFQKAIGRGLTAAGVHPLERASFEQLSQKLK